MNDPTPAAPAELTARIRAASTLDQLTAVRGAVVTHKGPVEAGSLFEVVKLYGQRRRQLEGEQRRRELADAAAEEPLAAELAHIDRLQGHSQPRPNRRQRAHQVALAATGAAL
jgi:hypothetical protein